MTSVSGVAGLRSLPAVGRPHGAASTQGNAPPCEVAMQMHGLSESRDREKAKESTFHASQQALGGCWTQNQLGQRPWKGNCSEQGLTDGSMCLGRGGIPPPLPICASGCYLTCKIQTLKFSKYPICVFLCDSCIVIALLVHYAGARLPQPAPSHAQPPEEQAKARLLCWCFLTFTCLICCQSNLFFPYSSAVGSAVALQVNCTVCTEAYYL